MNKFVRHLKRKVSKILERNCVRDLSKGPETTPNAQENISIRMDYGGSRKDRLLQKEYLPVRLKYPKDNLEKKDTNWNHIIWKGVTWSDETKLDLFCHTDVVYVWRNKGESHNPQNTVPIVMILGTPT